MKMKELITRYRKSRNYLELAPKSQAQYDRILEFAQQNFTKELDNISHVDIIEMRDMMGDTPGKANLHIAVTSALMRYAAEIGEIKVNPCLGVRKLRMGEHKPWSERSINTFKEESVGLARRGFYLGLMTGQRIEDILNMQTNDIRNWEKILVHQQKTGTKVFIPLHPELRKEMTHWDLHKWHNLYLMGSEVTYSTFNRAFVNECRRLHVDETFHGLRKTVAKMLADAGCSDREIMAITGHQTNSMINYYTKAADQEKRAENAMRRLIG